MYHNHIPLCCDITLNVFSSIFMTNALVSLLFFNVMLKEKTVLALLENDMAVLKKVYMAESDKKESIF